MSKCICWKCGHEVTSVLNRKTGNVRVIECGCLDSGDSKFVFGDVLKSKERLGSIYADRSVEKLVIGQITGKLNERRILDANAH